MDAISRLIKIFNDRSNKNNSNLSKQLLSNIRNTEDMTIYELADKCYTSTTAISRFVRQMGYSNFAQFKLSVHDAVNLYYRANRVIPRSKAQDDGSVAKDYVGKISNSLLSFEEELDESMLLDICDLIENSQNIVCISPTIGDFNLLQYDLFLQGKHCMYFDNLAEVKQYAMSIDKNTFALIYVPLEWESDELGIILKEFQKADVKMAFFASKGNLILKKYSDLHVGYRPTNTNLDNLLFLFFMDILTITYRKSYVN